jgi:hypothetical protein
VKHIFTSDFFFSGIIVINLVRKLSKLEQIFGKQGTIPLTVASGFTKLPPIRQQKELLTTARQGDVEPVFVQKASGLLNETQNDDICFLTLTLINSQGGDSVIVALEFELYLPLLFLILRRSTSQG